MNSQIPFQANQESLSFEAQRVLRALFELSRAVRNIEAGTLAGELGLRPTQVGKALLELERRGLICVERLRLTMTGLARATRLPGQALLASMHAEAVAARGVVCEPRGLVVPIEAARVVSPHRAQARAARERPAGGRLLGVRTGRLRRVSEAPGR